MERACRLHDGTLQQWTKDAEERGGEMARLSDGLRTQAGPIEIGQ